VCQIFQGIMIWIYCCLFHFVHIYINFPFSFVVYSTINDYIISNIHLKKEKLHHYCKYFFFFWNVDCDDLILSNHITHNISFLRNIWNQINLIIKKFNSWMLITLIWLIFFQLFSSCRIINMLLVCHVDGC